MIFKECKTFFIAAMPILCSILTEIDMSENVNNFNYKYFFPNSCNFPNPERYLNRLLHEYHVHCSLFTIKINCFHAFNNFNILCTMYSSPSLPCSLNIPNSVFCLATTSWFFFFLFFIFIYFNL